jgi:hypothetical protein
VFSGFRWPVPGPADDGGSWVEAGRVVPCREGIHGSRPSGVGFWLNEDLWELELDGDITEVGTKVVATRGRLTRRIEEWAGGAARELVEATAFRARDTAVTFCRNGSSEASDAADALDVLAACTAAGALGPAALAAYDAMPEGLDERMSLGLVIDAAHFLDGHVCHTPFISACTAAHAASARTGRRADWKAAVSAERSWQSAWITARLGLEV